jgi:hypothetical protein
LAIVDRDRPSRLMRFDEELKIAGHGVGYSTDAEIREFVEFERVRLAVSSLWFAAGEEFVRLEQRLRRPWSVGQSRRRRARM